MLKPREIMIKLRTSFWFIPMVSVLFTIGLGMILIEVDSHTQYKWSDRWPRLFGVGAEGARGMLSTIAGSIMTMMGVTFSMTLVTLALASSQYSSRVLRNFIRNRLTQCALGVFAAIFTYCLIVLRTIREGETPFIPNLSIFVGFIFALLGVAVLVLFIHHVATSIQASNIISSVAEETEKGIDKLFPEELGEDGDTDKLQGAPPKNSQTIVADRSGYIQTLNESVLIDLSNKIRGRVWVNYSIGDFVVQGMPLVTLETEEDPKEKAADYVRKAFSLQQTRTIEEDVLFGVRQLVDIALKALSPGVNDTTTAILCIDYLTSILSHLVNRKFPSPVREIDGTILVIVKRPVFSDYLSEAFSQIRSDGRGNFAVQRRLLWSYETLAQLTKNKHRRWILGSEARKSQEIILTFDLESEKRKLEGEYDRVNQEITLS